MTLTKKEQGLLKDLQNEEKLCVEKYRKAAENACDAKLQHIFEKIEKAEQSHYDTVTGMLAGTLPAQQGQQSKGQASRQKAEKDLKSTASRTEKTARRLSVVRSVGHGKICLRRVQHRRV